MFAHPLTSSRRIVITHAAASSAPSARILGGVTSRRNEFPHQCAIEVIPLIGPPQIIGAGSVISRRFILTVASNVVADNVFRRTEVLCGRNDLSLASEVTEQRMRIARAHIHTRYNANRPSSAYDIAVLQLTAELHFSEAVQPIALPVADSAPAGIVSLIGWGGTDELWFGQRLQRLQLQRVAIEVQAQCTEYLARWQLQRNDTHICTGPATGGVSPCDEDRGSALVQLPVAAGGARTVVGLVSLPQGCGAPGWLGTYTRVSTFVAWINQVTVI